MMNNLEKIYWKYNFIKILSLMKVFNIIKIKTQDF